MSNKITNFRTVTIRPEEYRHLRHPSARSAEKNPDLTLYYSLFVYRGRTGYRYNLFTKNRVNVINIIKDECLKWAQANY